MTRFSPHVTFADNVYQSYLQGLKVQWKDLVYQQVAQDAAQSTATDACAMEVDMRERSSAYRLYGWMERHLQQFKYLGRHGMIPLMTAQEPALKAALDAAADRHPERLRLDPTLPLPAYYTRADFHQHPGGIWSDDADAFAYEWAANAFSFSMIGANGPYEWLARYLNERFAPDSFLDIACGFGKLAIPFKAINPCARVTGLDLSAPLLRLAHLRALESDLAIDWVQANAESLPAPDNSIGGAAAYWLFHELPEEAARNVLAETLRVVKPGGFFATLDLYTAPGGVTGAFLHIGHGARNSEPYLPGMVMGDPCAQMREAGFIDVEMIEAMTGAPETRRGQPLPAARAHLFSVVVGRKPL